ncbi:MAG: hypothetical protein WA175_03165 [Candidatus Acidiferrales bacterium]
MPDNNTILAVLQSEIGLAGLLLVFAGFLLTKSASVPSEYKTRFTILCGVTLLSFLGDLGLSFLCVRIIKGNPWGEGHVLCDLEISLVLTALVGICGLVASL